MHDILITAPTHNRAIYVCLACVALFFLFPLSASAQSGSVPQYISSMSEYEVRALENQYAPTNGTSSMQSITPDEWLNNDPSVLGLSGVIVAWNGGAKGNGSKLFVHGGGHTDGANNGMYIFDFGGMNRPTGWEEPLVISNVADIRAESAAYADGYPNSVHTYDGIVYASHNNHIYRFGGSQYRSGNLTNSAFKFNVATNEWTQLPNFPGGGSSTRTFYDPASGNIFVTAQNTTTGYFLRTDNDSWSGPVSYNGGGFPFDSMAAWDSTRSRAIVVGDNARSLVTIDFSSETVSVQNFNPTGSTQILGERGISAVYDPIGDVYWMFGGPTASSGWSFIYEMRADGNSWTISRHSLVGETIVRHPSLVGSWGRYVLMPQWRAIGLIASETSAAFVIRLPDSSTTIPNPPTDLQSTEQ